MRSHACSGVEMPPTLTRTSLAPTRSLRRLSTSSERLETGAPLTPPTSMASTSGSSVGLFLLSATLTVPGISATHGPKVLPWGFYASALCIGYIAAARSATSGAAQKTPSCGLVVVAVATPWILPILRGGARRLRYRHRDFRPRRTLPTQSAVLDGVYHCSLTPLAAALAFFTAIKNPVAATA